MVQKSDNDALLCSQEMIEELRKWLKSLPDLSSRQVNCGSDVLEVEVVTKLENYVEEFTV